MLVPQCSKKLVRGYAMCNCAKRRDAKMISWFFSQFLQQNSILPAFKPIS